MYRAGRSYDWGGVPAILVSTKPEVVVPGLALSESAIMFFITIQRTRAVSKLVFSTHIVNLQFHYTTVSLRALYYVIAALKEFVLVLRQHKGTQHGRSHRSSL
jgi:hypothetical protein